MKHTYKALAVIVALLAVFLWTSWPVRHVHAIQDSEDFPPPFGVAVGQTARLTLLNTGDTAIVGPEYRFLNARGEVLSQSPDHIVILPGQFRSFDFDLPNPPPGVPDIFGRIQIRAEVTAMDARTLHVSVEVFDNATGKTTLILQPPPRPD